MYDKTDMLRNEEPGHPAAYAFAIAIHEYRKTVKKIQKMEGTYTETCLPHMEWPLICRCDREFPLMLPTGNLSGLAGGPCRGECKPKPPWVEAAISQTGVTLRPLSTSDLAERLL